MFLWIFPLVIISIIGIFVGLWMWTVYLETAKPASVRFALHIFLFICQLIEFWVWYQDNLKQYIIFLLVFCNFWGMFDAILRYPIVHDLDTFFSLKLILIIGGKTMAYALGFRNMGKNASAFLACLFGCVWSVPLLYVMALPIGDTRAQQSKHDVRDMDVLEKIKVLLFEKQNNEMRLEFQQYMVWWKDTFIWIGLKIPIVSSIIIKMNLVDRRQLRKPAGREI